MMVASRDPSSAAPRNLPGSLRQLVTALKQIEELPAGATGALVAGDPRQPTAAVLVEQGRICWVAAPAMRRRLTDLLRHQAQPVLSSGEMEDFYQACRDRGQPLGEALVAEGRLTTSALRASLKRHSAESLLAPEVWAERLSWVAHRARGYQPSYTFRPAELLIDAGASLSSSGRVARAGTVLTALTGVSTAVFAPGGTLLLAVDELLEQQLTVGEWTALGNWAHRALRQLPEDCRQVRYLTRARETSWLAWRFDRLLCATCCPTRQGFSALIAKLDRLGFAGAALSSAVSD